VYSGITTKSDHPSYPLHAIIGADLRGPAAPLGAFVLRTLSEVSAVMGVFCVCEPERTAAADRTPPCYRFRRGGRALARAGKNATASPRPPLLFRGSNRFALPPLTRPTNKKSIAASPPAVKSL
jgi:hypothetical protein